MAAQMDQAHRKHAVVVGAGLAGVTTAFKMSQSGYDVTVVERNGGVALETSFANAGRFCPSVMYDGPLASPSALKGLVQATVTSIIKPRAGPLTLDALMGMDAHGPSSIQWSWGLVRWGLYFIRGCVWDRHELNVRACKALAVQAEGAMQAALCLIDKRNGSNSTPGKADSSNSGVRSAIAYRPGTIHTFKDRRHFLSRVAELEALPAAECGMDDNECVATVKSRYEICDSYERAKTASPFLALWRRADAAPDAASRDELMPGVVVAREDWSANARSFCESLAQACQLQPTASPSVGVGKVAFAFNSSIASVTLEKAATVSNSSSIEDKSSPGTIGSSSSSVSTRLRSLVCAPVKWLVAALRGPARSVSSVTLNDGRQLHCDVLVLAAGMHTRTLAKDVFDAYVPLHAMRGYSLELRGCAFPQQELQLQHQQDKDTSNNDDKCAVDIAVADEGSGALRFQMLPLDGDGSTVRLIGFAEFVSTCDPQPSQQDIERARTFLLTRLGQVLPQMTWKEEGAVWSGSRPMSPDGLPIVGLLPGYGNVCVNTGHGTMGWTLSAATADLLTHSLLAKHGVKNCSNTNIRSNSALGVTSGGCDRSEGAIELTATVCSPERFMSLKTLLSDLGAYCD